MKPPAKLGLLAALYFSQGLPFGFFTQALPVLLRQRGYSLGAIGLSSMLALPWALKFLWAPTVDRFGLARFGRRKSWIVPLQLASAVTLIAVAVAGAEQHFQLLLAAVFLLNLFAATQDIATDGLAVDMLSVRERGLSNGIQVAGYRVGMIIGGGALLVAYDNLGPATTFVVMAALTIVATLPVLAAREPEAPRRVSSSRPHTHFLRRPRAKQILTLVVVYKLGDAFATGMLRPFLTDLGLSLSQIGWLLGTVGFVAGLLGALAGGALVNVLGRKRSLLTFGTFQAGAVAGYALLAGGKPGLVALYTVSAVEHFAGGMATAALFTCMMDWCSKESSATDYTVQASAVVIATGLAAVLAGISAQNLGYQLHFGVSTGLAAVAVLAVHRLFPAPDQQTTESATEVGQCA